MIFLYQGLTPDFKEVFFEGSFFKIPIIIAYYFRWELFQNVYIL